MTPLAQNTAQLTVSTAKIKHGTKSTTLKWIDLPHKKFMLLFMPFVLCIFSFSISGLSRLTVPKSQVLTGTSHPKTTTLPSLSPMQSHIQVCNISKQ
jgi:hypothetical protein